MSFGNAACKDSPQYGHALLFPRASPPPLSLILTTEPGSAPFSQVQGGSMLLWMTLSPSFQRTTFLKNALRFESEITCKHWLCASDSSVRGSRRQGGLTQIPNELTVICVSFPCALSSYSGRVIQCLGAQPGTSSEIDGGQMLYQIQLTDATGADVPGDCRPVPLVDLR
jgi:hypothetical protein